MRSEGFSQGRNRKQSTRITAQFQIFDDYLIDINIDSSIRCSNQSLGSVRPALLFVSATVALKIVAESGHLNFYHFGVSADSPSLSNLEVGF